MFCGAKQAHAAEISFGGRKGLAERLLYVSVH